MFITCQECNTTYRLDERLLKPTGSKVRCSQCRHKFIAVPASTATVTASIQEPLVQEVPMPKTAKPLVSSPIPEEKALEGIDLAELDEIMKGDDGAFSPADEPEVASDTAAAIPSTDQLADLDEIDFDTDSDSVKDSSELEAGKGPEELDDIELDMDFEIDSDDLAPEEDIEDLDLAPAIEEAEALIKSSGDGVGAEPSIEDDLEMVLEGLELDSEETGESAEAPLDKGAIADDLGLEDLEFDLEGEAPMEEIEGEEPDFSLDEDLEFGLDEPESLKIEASDEVPDTAADELDLDFDLDLDDTPTEADAEVEDVELSLEDEFDLQLDEAPTEGEADKEVAASEDEDLDLTGLDTLMGTGDESVPEDLELSLEDEFDLQLDETPAKGGADKEVAASEDEDLDLSGLDTLLGTGDDFDAAGIDLNLDDALDIEENFELKDDLDLEMNEGPSNGLADAEGGFDEELDLTGLDTIMGSGDDEGDGILAELEEPDLELDEPDLELDSGKPETAIAAEFGAAADAELEDFDFELDTEFENKPAAKQAEKAAEAESSREEEEEIDLSDIEQMLGGEAEPAKASTKAPEQEEGPGDIGGLDLADIESALDEAELTAVDDPDVQDEPELELDLNFDPSAAKKEAPADFSLDLEAEPEELDIEEDLDLELDSESESPLSGAGDTVALEGKELDLSDLGDIVEEAETSAKHDTISTGDIELEFQIEEDETPAATTTRTTAGLAKAAAPASDFSLDQTMGTLAADETLAAEPTRFKPKKKSSKSLFLLFILILLGGIGYGLYYAVTQMGIEIPYVSDYLNPKPKDPSGTMLLATLNINSKFIENGQSGRLFVITGKVRNGYSTSRGNIRLQGRLFTKGKVISKTEFSYAGAMISDQDLASLPIAEIKQRLNAEAKPQEARGNIRPGQNVPFMVVFSDLPPMDELDEFAVELVSSVPGR